MTERSPQGAVQLAVFFESGVMVHALPPGGRLLIGRADECDVRIADAAVSRRHAIIHVGPPLQIEDLGGANGTLVSAAGGRSGRAETVHLRRLSSERAELSVGDAVNLGGAVAVIRRAPAASPPETAGPGEGEVVLRDDAMRLVYEQAGRAAQSMLPVLVLGETGVGKDVLARAIHRMSPRASKPFLALNCAALAESLLESELFGHEKGAFTGALTTRPGLIESADGGTLFLDEIGDMPLSTQVKLLRVLEQREVMRVGARAPRSINVRFVAATNQELESAASAGRFRQDLYFRLNGLSLTIPPLRERRGEIAEFARRFLASASSQLEQSVAPTLSPQALAALEAYSWPGNVRELRNVIERAVVLATGESILLEHLPPKVAARTTEPSATPARPASSEMDQLKRDLNALARQRVLDALAQCDGNQTRAAELLGVSRRTLINRLEEYGIERPRKRPPQA
jgi:two-component system, NtrC family, response regulator AtoC